MANLTFALRSGRQVGVTTFGDADAERIVVFCHAAPGSSVFDPDPDESANRDVHIVALDRPGYGSSDPWPAGQWPSIAQAADDIAEYLRALIVTETPLSGPGHRTVGVAGWSAGGRVALALAARHPALVDRVAIVATPAPNEHVQWIDRPLQAEAERLGQLPAGEAQRELSDMLRGQLDAVRAAESEGDVPAELVGAGTVDEEVLGRPGVRDRLGRSLRDAYRQGAGGVAADILSYTARPWGFDPAEVRAKTLIVGGQADPIAGNAHAAWYRRAVPGARMEMVPGAGHLVIVPAWGRVLSHLAPGTLRR